jgi:hypothetical protein
MYVIAGVTPHVGSVAAKELLAKKKPLKVIVRGAKKAETVQSPVFESLRKLDDAERRDNDSAITFRSKRGEKLNNWNIAA